jgi:hypothetical protein
MYILVFPFLLDQFSASRNHDPAGVTNAHAPFCALMKEEQVVQMCLCAEYALYTVHEEGSA